MDVAMMQPAFLPWQGFFELIYKSEKFIFLDDFQFSVQSYHQRNRLFVNKGQVDWYSVPVKKAISFKSPLNKTSINEQMSWRSKTWKRMQNNYSRTTYYAELAPQIEEWLLTPAESLAVQNIAFIRLVCKMMGLEREFILSSEFLSQSQKSKRVVELLKWCNADRYYCAKGSFDYMLEEGIFPIDDIQVLFQDFTPESYSQVGSPQEFIPYLSILDGLMNIGPQATFELIKNGTPKWISWEDMKSMNYQ
jgi:hypothetical protein